MTSYEAVLLGMTLNAGAYLTEIQRAGFQSVRRTEMDAAVTLGMSRLQQVRYVILPHIARTLFPPLSNHYILMTLGTSMAAIFGVEELTDRVDGRVGWHRPPLGTDQCWKPPRNRRSGKTGRAKCQPLDGAHKGRRQATAPCI